MPNKLHIETVDVCHRREADRQTHGVFVYDDISTFNVLDFESAAQVPSTLGGVVSHCKEQELADVLDLIQHHADAGHGLWHDGQQVSNADVRAALATPGAQARAAA